MAALLITVAVVLVGGIRLADMLSLPGCDDARTLQAVAALLDDKKIKVAPLHDVTSVSSTGAERICAAQMEQPAAFFRLQYRVGWNGWTPQTSLVDVIAEARIEPAHLNEVKKAVSDFLAMARDAPATGRPPRLAEPAARALLEKIFDLARIEGAVLTASDIPKASEWFDAADRVGAMYILAGTGVSDARKLPNTAAMQQRTHANVVQFSAEFAWYLDWQVKLAGIMAMADLKRPAAPESDGEAKRQRERVRSIFAQSLSGALTSLAYDGLGDEWRRQRLAVLTSIAPDATKTLSPEEARAVRQHALTVATFVRNKGLQDGIRALADLVAPP